MSKMFRKSQAAMEFLMTYGWAILVVLVAIGALAYFGVLSPDKFLPSKCTLPSGLACLDFVISNSAAATPGITVEVRNGLGYDISGIEVSFASDSDAVGSACGEVDSAPATLQNGAKDKWTIPCATLEQGKKVSGSFAIKYDNAESGFTHTSNGSITGRVE